MKEMWNQCVSYEQILELREIITAITYGELFLAFDMGLSSQ